MTPVMTKLVPPIATPEPQAYDGVADEGAARMQLHAPVVRMLMSGLNYGVSPPVRWHSSFR